MRWQHATDTGRTARIGHASLERSPPSRDPRPCTRATSALYPCHICTGTGLKPCCHLIARPEMRKGVSLGSALHACAGAPYPLSRPRVPQCVWLAAQWKLGAIGCCDWTESSLRVCRWFARIARQPIRISGMRATPRAPSPKGCRGRAGSAAQCPIVPGVQPCVRACCCACTCESAWLIARRRGARLSALGCNGIGCGGLRFGFFLGSFHNVQHTSSRMQQVWFCALDSILRRQLPKRLRQIRHLCVL
jgi:hypothetical protein